MSQPLLSVGGLASGMDTQSIVDKLVQLESQPLTALQQHQSAYGSQVSALGDLASRLGALETAATGLASGGTLALQATSTNTAFSAVPGSAALAGSYAVQVESLASPAKWRSGPIAPTDALKAGSLTLSIGGVTYPPASSPILIDGTTTLGGLAGAIRASGAPVSVSVLDDGTSQYLSITTTASGYSGTDPTTALQVNFDYGATPPATGVDPGAASWHQDAINAVFYVDALKFTRASNTVTDALPGTALTLKSAGGPAETLAIATDPAGTATRLQTFVDAYNGIMTAVQKQLTVDPNTDRTTTLAGDSTVRMLQQDLQALVSSQVGGLGAVRTLADLGVKTQRDGTLTLDQSTLAGAVAREPAAVNAIFADASSGIASLVSARVGTYTAATTGLLSLRQNGLQAQIRAMDDQAASMQARIDAFRDGLARQFAAMEDVVSQLKSIGSFLTSQDNAASSKS